MRWGFQVLGIKFQELLGKMFELVSDYVPLGDQPQAIKLLTEGLNAQKKAQVLLGITGSGKTFTIANVIANVNRPTLVIAHNKTLAAQLYQEFKAFFPKNAVEYFVSYYDYYQPEAYIARTDTYIEKDMAINDQIDQLRLSATRSLLERDDVVIVASVSCIYGLGSPEYYRGMNLTLHIGEEKRRDDTLLHLVEMQYKRNDIDFSRGHFRVRGDVLEIFPAYEEDLGVRVEFFGDEIERIATFDPLTGRTREKLETITIYPSSHHVTPEDVRERALVTIREELKERCAYFEKENRLVELQRIDQRTRHDLEMIKEVGFCKGIENYSRHFGFRSEGEPPSCLMDYFPKNFLVVIDESHQTVPQLRAMYNGDRARKASLIDFGFRLPSAYDNRPLKFEETYQRLNQVIYVSATPAEFEVSEALGEEVMQVIRPTGLLDPEIEVRKASGQVDDCLEEIRIEAEKGGRILVTTLTKKLSEELSKYLTELGLKAKYLHSDIDTVERIQIINDLREGIFDVLVGINLLREGLDIPEVSLVVILDADKEGFLRSETSLIQTCGRAARNSQGRVIMYADKETESIKKTLKVTRERREKQKAYNEAHGIEPKTVYRKREALIEQEKPTLLSDQKEYLTKEKIEERALFYKKEMEKAALERRFEDAATFRDKMHDYEHLLLLE